jgi:16S rRNA (adenine1518-N6/adenine1519-N6)-dimethyltransferase
MVEELALKAIDNVVEIGPGRGAVTKQLLEQQHALGFSYTGIEKDDFLYNTLKNTFPNTSFVNKDALDYFRNQKLTKFKVCGSLPYNAATGIINLMCKLTSPPEACVFLVQVEFGQKLEGKETMNAVAAFVQGFYNVELVKKVKNTLFFPIPKVDGAIITLTYKGNAIDPYRYEKFIRRFFSQPRKMINKVFTDVELKSMQLDSTKRAADFNTQEIITAYYNLYDKSPLRAS